METKKGGVAFLNIWDFCVMNMIHIFSKTYPLLPVAQGPTHINNVLLSNVNEKVKVNENTLKIIPLKIWAFIHLVTL